MNKKSVGCFMVMVLFFLAGCQAKLSEKKVTFKSSSYAYQFQLPDSWDKQDESSYKGEYGNQAIFGAEDSISKSEMFIQASSLSEVDLTDFGAKTRKNLQEIYDYSKLDDIYMKEYEVGKNQAYKYTLNGQHEGDSVWVHCYYVITDNELIEFIFYSADDNRFEERVEIIDESVSTLTEKEPLESTADEEATTPSQESKEEKSSETMVENKEMSIAVTGYRNLTVGDQAYLAIRYTVTNKSESELEPLVWYEKAKVKLGDDVLAQADFPNDDAVGNLKVLAEDNTKKLKKGETGNGLAFYSISTDEEDKAYVEFLESEFEQAEPIGFDLSRFN